MFDPVYRGSEVIEVLRILFKNSLQPYGSRLSYETYRSPFLYKRVLPQKIFFLKYKNYGGNIYFFKKRFKKKIQKFWNSASLFKNYKDWKKIGWKIQYIIIIYLLFFWFFENTLYMHIVDVIEMFVWTFGNTSFLIFYFYLYIF